MVSEWNSWQQFTLGDLCSLITDGKHGDCEDQPNSGFYFLSVKDVVGNRLIYENARQITERDFSETHRRTNLQAGDVLFTNTGTIGRMAIAQDDPRTYRTTFQKSVAILKPKRDLINPHFLYYLLKFENARLSEFAAGTTQKNLLLKDLRNFSLRVPPVVDQNAIVNILGTLDEKIELNRRTNETLEAIARAIFKSWFVDFDPVRAKVESRDSGLPKFLADLFPDSFGQLGLGDIPQGWRVCGIDEIARFLNGLALQKYPPKDGRSIPVIKIAQLRAGNTNNADAASADLESEYIVEDGDVLFSWSGSLECVLWTGGRGALNQHLFKVTSAQYPKWFYYLWINEHLAEFRRIAAAKATTMGHIQRHHLSEAKVALPSRALLDAADRHVRPLVDAIVTLRIQSRTLASIRDVLLKKLLSGEIRVENTDRIIGVDQ
jgi:type I restriction enzyme, S subunit